MAFMFFKAVHSRLLYAVVFLANACLYERLKPVRVAPLRSLPLCQAFSAALFA